ncbi:hypothetical protein KVU_1050 [Ketogulonicigenium vulgare WSH-001]|uniref:Uncharacterized protein n=1 Tax=Ketogulonicigenium vulgare (strain WSH-001) TaxID=759362 RepID=F9Y6E3_KETVW|nr:hypothetical protein KVU_1050 [Ketogulonicigenium vulgare WSH-001]
MTWGTAGDECGNCSTYLPEARPAQGTVSWGAAGKRIEKQAD